MADLIVVVPTRSRPAAVAPLAAAFDATCTAHTKLVFAVDDSDPAREEYLAAGTASHRSHVQFCDSSTMVEALNLAAARLPEHFAVGFMGDDHMPRTVGWDTAYLEALRDLGTGMVYGDDLVQQARIPTQIAMTSDIVRALGWMAPPVLTHLYVDNFWLSLGQAAGCIRYLPGVVVEHRHPAAGTAPVDDGYLRVNNSAMYARDEAAFRRFEADGHFTAAVETVRALRGAA